MKKYFLYSIFILLTLCITTTNSWAKYSGNPQAFGISGNIGGGTFFTCDDCQSNFSTHMTYGGDVHYAYRFSQRFALRLMAGIEATPWDHLGEWPIFPSLDLTNIFYLNKTKKGVEPYLGIGVGTKGIHGNIGVKANLQDNFAFFIEAAGGSYLFRNSGQVATGVQVEF